MRGRKSGVIVFVVILFALFSFGLLAINNRPEQYRFEPGIGGGPEVANSDSATPEDRAMIHRLLQEHVAVSAIYLENLYNERDITQSRELLNSNSSALISSLSSMSQGNSEGKLKELWERQIELYGQYLSALKENNRQEALNIRSELTRLSEEFGNEAEESLPNISSSSVRAAMEEHTMLTLSLIDNIGDGDDTRIIEQAARTAVQISRLAETLTPTFY